MKEWLISGLLILGSLLLGVTLLFPVQKEISIITSPKIYSFYHTELNEQFKLSFLIDKEETYYLNKDYISQIELLSGEEILPLTLSEIYVQKEPIEHQSKEYYVVELLVSLGITSNDFLIHQKESYLHISYLNQKEITIYIGEFNYVFEEDSPPFSLYSLKATFDTYNGINTISGLAIELYNGHSKNITIERIDCLSQQVTFNNDYSRHKERDIELFELPQEILLDDYDYALLEENPNTHLIYSRQSKQIYVPITYKGDISHIERFSIVVEVKIDGEQKTYYVDDFIFMNQSLFSPSYESGFHYYEIEE